MCPPFGNRKRSFFEVEVHLASHSTVATVHAFGLSFEVQIPSTASSFPRLAIGGSPCYDAGRRYERTRVPWKGPVIGELHEFSFRNKPSGSLNKHWIENSWLACTLESFSCCRLKDGQHLAWLRCSGVACRSDYSM